MAVVIDVSNELCMGEGEPEVEGGGVARASCSRGDDGLVPCVRGGCGRSGNGLEVAFDVSARVDEVSVVVAERVEEAAAGEKVAGEVARRGSGRELSVSREQVGGATLGRGGCVAAAVSSGESDEEEVVGEMSLVPEGGGGCEECRRRGGLGDEYELAFQMDDGGLMIANVGGEVVSAITFSVGVVAELAMEIEYPGEVGGRDSGCCIMKMSPRTSAGAAGQGDRGGVIEIGVEDSEECAWGDAPAW